MTWKNWVKAQEVSFRVAGNHVSSEAPTCLIAYTVSPERGSEEKSPSAPMEVRTPAIQLDNSCTNQLSYVKFILNRQLQSILQVCLVGIQVHIMVSS